MPVSFRLAIYSLTVACSIAGAAEAQAGSAFFVQLGTAGSEGEAEGKFQAMQKEFPALLGKLPFTPRTVVPLGGGKSMEFRIQAGPARSRDHARRVCASLMAKGTECFIVETAVFEGEPSSPRSATSRNASAPVEKKAAARAVAEPIPDASPDEMAAFEMPASEMSAKRAAKLEKAEETQAALAPAPAPEPQVQAMRTPKATEEESSFFDFRWLTGDDEKNEKPSIREANAEPSTEQPARVSGEFNEKRAEALPEAVPAPAPEPAPVAPPVAESAPQAAPEPAAEPKSRSRGLFASRARGIVPPPPPPIPPASSLRAAKGGRVEVAEAIPVPISGDVHPTSAAPLPLSGGGTARAISPQAAASRGWLKITGFSGEERAQGFIAAMHASLEETKSLRARVTRPVSGRHAARPPEVLVGPMEDGDSTARICAFAQSYDRGLECSGSASLPAIPAAAEHKPRALPNLPQPTRFFAQLGSWKNRAAALRRFETLKSRHRDVLGGMQPNLGVPAQASIGAQPNVRLRVGPFAEQSQAESLCERLSAAGTSCLVVGEE